MRWRRAVAIGYAIALIGSHLVTWRAQGPRFEPAHGVDAPSMRTVEVGVGDGAPPEAVAVAYERHGEGGRPCVVLLHGSPGTLQDFRALAAALAESFDVIVPDLPGFGRSQRRVADYSARAHAACVLRLLEDEGVERAHLVGFSMGGAVAIEAAARDPDRVASIALVAGLGVEELELLGDHRLNRAIHFAQYALIRAVDLFVPHFGAFDRFPLGVSYARNFLDTDQSRLRGLLERYAGPLRIVHGEHDSLVPYAAALEHRRIVPQSDLVTLPADHFLLWTHAPAVEGVIREFVTSVDSGAASDRVHAEPSRVEEAARPFDPSLVPPPGFVAQFVLAVLLAIATFVSEDLACIGGGFLVASGRLSAVAAVSGCLIGIFVGDVLLFLLGRALGKPLLDATSARSRFVSPTAIARGRDLLGEHGGKAILLSRFTPGLRLPTYLAAGALGMPLPRFAAWFLFAAILWTPCLVLLSARFGAAIEDWLAMASAAGGLWFAVSVILSLAIVHSIWRLLVSLATPRGRRLLRGRIERWRRYEFWPPYVFYPPVIAKLAQLSWRHRRDGGFAVVTAVNPGIETSGFVGESKKAILDGLRDDSGRVARYALVRANDSIETRRAVVQAFRERHGLSLPLVLKPDVGQRGSGVSIVRDERDLERFLAESMTVDHVVQEYVAGVEYGIFWVKESGAPRGRIISVTEKRMPVIAGDGRRTLEELILADDRAFCAAETYFAHHRARLRDVLPAGERVQLVELGTHCRGAIFLDGSDIVTPQLEEWVESVSRRFEGFAFGRYDVRGASPEHFRRADGIRVIELNGVTSEATHLYDPKHSLREAYSILFEQWRLAFAIGAANARAGASTTSPFALLRRFLAYRKAQRGHR